MKNEIDQIIIDKIAWAKKRIAKGTPHALSAKRFLDGDSNPSEWAKMVADDLDGYEVSALVDVDVELDALNEQLYGKMSPEQWQRLFDFRCVVDELMQED